MKTQFINKLYLSVSRHKFDEIYDIFTQNIQIPVPFIAII